MQKKVLVIGAGLAGMMTAYYLAADGFDVTVIDAASECGDGASHANGGQLSYMYADPFGSPAMLLNLPEYIFSHHDKSVFLSMRPDPAMWEWYALLLLQCLPWLTWRNTRKILELNLYSRQMLMEFQQRENIDFDFSTHGKLHIYYNQKSFKTAAAAAAKLDSADHPQIILSPAQCTEKEPAIAHLEPRLAGGIFSSIDSAGDALKFIRGLSRIMSRKSMSVKFIYSKKIDGFARYDDKILAAMAGTDGFTADEFVIAAGCHSRQLLAALGIHTPIYPIKGYSITAPIVDESKVNNASITDHGKRLVFTRLGDYLRVAGFAEFAGYDTSVPAERASLLQRWTQQMLPDAVDMSRATTWAGLRPGLPHSVPMLGRSKTIGNLHLNTGHGMLGWTMAHGTARIVADGIRQL